VDCKRALWTSLFVFWQFSCLAAFYNNQIYPGNGAGGLGGTIASGTLRMSNNAYTVYGSFTNVINGSFSLNLVMFIDSAPGGYTNTRRFSDNNIALESAISGFKSERSVAQFAPGFAADYAIAMSPNHGCSLYKLADDGAGPYLQLIRTGAAMGFGPTDNINSHVFYFQFDWADIGLPQQKTNFFKFETSYISDDGSRSLESFESLTGSAGFNTITFNNYDTFGVPPVPENTNLALAIFGGIVVSVTVGRRLARRADSTESRAETSDHSGPTHSNPRIVLRRHLR
jgi:hypothetical protein